MHVVGDAVVAESLSHDLLDAPVAGGVAHRGPAHHGRAHDGGGASGAAQVAAVLIVNREPGHSAQGGPNALGQVLNL